MKNGEVEIIDDCDYELVKDRKWYATHSHGSVYAHCYQYMGKKNGKSVSKTSKMHRLIMGVTDPKIIIDHIDHNGLNNSRSNLRICTPQQNNWNRRKNKKNAKSKYMGVSYKIAINTLKSGEKKEFHYWMASITVNKKFIALGYFKTEEEAALAYDNYITIHRGEYASLNFKKSA